MATPKTTGTSVFTDRISSILSSPTATPPASLGTPSDRGPKPAGGGKGGTGRLSAVMRKRRDVPYGAGSYGSGKDAGAKKQA